MSKLWRFLFEPLFREGMQIKYILTHDKGFFRYILSENLKGKYNFIISNNAQVSPDVEFPHPHNVIIGGCTEVGKHCILYHDVTLGQNRGKYPILGNGVIVYAGARIIGNVEIGDNSIVGANSVVTQNVPENVIVAGVPARIIKMRVSKDEFY